MFVRKVAYAAALSVTLSTPPAVSPAMAGAQVSGPISVDVLEVHDGDTITVLAHLWPEQFIKTHVRVLGVDTPELRGRCSRETDLAAAAREMTEKFVRDGAPITIHNVKLDKYGGRVDADVIDARGRSLGRELLAARLAYVYESPRRTWCP